jgi:hypothetical protein
MRARRMQAPVEEDVHPVARAIDEMGAFLKSAIDTPGLLDLFPDSGEIGFREIDIHGHEFQLAVVGPETAEEAEHRAWEARPSRYAPRPEALPLPRPLTKRPFQPDDPVGRTLAVAEAFSAAGSTKQGALDALEEMLRAAIAGTEEPARRAG